MIGLSSSGRDRAAWFLLLAACAFGTDSIFAQAAEDRHVARGRECAGSAVRLRCRTDREAYVVGQPISLEIEMLNPLPEPVRGAPLCGWFRGAGTHSGATDYILVVKLARDAPVPQESIHNKVNVLVSVEPHLAGIPIVLDWRDVDDPSDFDGPIDDDTPWWTLLHVNNNDSLVTNGGSGPAFVLPSSAQTDADGLVEVVATVGWYQPGNNFRVVAGARAEEVWQAKALAPDADSRLFFDKNHDNQNNPDDGDVVLTESNIAYGVRTTPRLTVWRKLHVEVDSMGAPPQGTVFPDDGIPIDVAVADVPDPDTSLLGSAFAPAYVDVLPGSSYDDGAAPFLYHATSADAQTRGIPESQAYWAAYIIGAYEPSTNQDGDPNNETFTWGATRIDEPEYSAVYFEVLRDGHNNGAFPGWAGVYSQTYHEQQVVVHEIGHQFGLYISGNHPPAGYSIMSDAEHNPVVIPPNSFAEDERLLIRSVSSV